MLEYSWMMDLLEKKMKEARSEYNNGITSADFDRAKAKEQVCIDLVFEVAHKMRNRV